MLDKNWTQILVGLVALGTMFAFGCLTMVGLYFLAVGW